MNCFIQITKCLSYLQFSLEALMQAVLPHPIPARSYATIFFLLLVTKRIWYIEKSFKI